MQDGIYFSLTIVKDGKEYPMPRYELSKLATGVVDAIGFCGMYSPDALKDLIDAEVYGKRSGENG